MDTVKLLMRILKCGATGDFEIDCPSISDAELRELYLLSKKHDMAHLVGYVLDKNGLLDASSEVGEKFDKQLKLAVYRTTKMQYDYAEICSVLEAAEIPYIALKGVVIRKLYPEAWLRTSCDIDILIKDSDLKRASDALVAKGYQKKELEFHNQSFYTNSGTHLELHFNLNELDEALDAVLEKVWEYAQPRRGYEYELTNEFFVFYFISHMVCHFMHGGCGVRTILDLMLLRKKIQIDQNVLDELLNKAGLKKFYESAVKLTKVWFEDEEADELTLRMQNFILTGGVYGTTSNKVSISMTNKNNAAGHVFSRAFPPYGVMKSLYPALGKHPVLLPYYWIKRFCRLLFKKGKAKSAIGEIKLTQNVDKKQVEEMRKMLTELELI